MVNCKDRTHGEVFYAQLGRDNKLVSQIYICLILNDQNVVKWPSVLWGLSNQILRMGKSLILHITKPNCTKMRLRRPCLFTEDNNNLHSLQILYYLKFFSFHFNTKWIHKTTFLECPYSIYYNRISCDLSPKQFVKLIDKYVMIVESVH